MKSGSVFLTVVITVLIGMGMGAYAQFLADQPKIEEAQSRADLRVINAYDVVTNNQEQWNKRYTELGNYISEQDKTIKTLTKQNRTLRYYLDHTLTLAFETVKQRDTWHQMYLDATNPSLRLVNVR